MSQYVDGIMLNLPPSRITTLPVQYAPALLVRNKMHPAMSSSVPDLSRGILSFGNTPSPMMPAASSDGNTTHGISIIQPAKIMRRKVRMR
jgi:hypothetical protein